MGVAILETERIKPATILKMDGRDLRFCKLLTGLVGWYGFPL